MDKFDVLVIVIPHEDFESAVRGVEDWDLLANAVDRDTALAIEQEISDSFINR